MPALPSGFLLTAHAHLQIWPTPDWPQAAKDSCRDGQLQAHAWLHPQVVQAGALMLMDAGCERHGYASDITRTWPISGHFSGPQRAVYDVVLAAHRCGPGLQAYVIPGCAPFALGPAGSDPISAGLLLGARISWQWAQAQAQPSLGFCKICSPLFSMNGTYMHTHIPAHCYQGSPQPGAVAHLPGRTRCSNLSTLHQAGHQHPNVYLTLTDMISACCGAPKHWWSTTSFLATHKHTPLCMQTAGIRLSARRHAAHGPCQGCAAAV